MVPLVTVIEVPVIPGDEKDPVTARLVMVALVTVARLIVALFANRLVVLALVEEDVVALVVEA
jgi:hypothetical protein